MWNGQIARRWCLILTHIWVFRSIRLLWKVSKVYPAIYIELVATLLIQVVSALYHACQVNPELDLVDGVVPIFGDSCVVPATWDVALMLFSPAVFLMCGPDTTFNLVFKCIGYFVFSSVAHVIADFHDTNWVRPGLFMAVEWIIIFSIRMTHLTSQGVLNMFWITRVRKREFVVAAVVLAVALVFYGLGSFYPNLYWVFHSLWHLFGNEAYYWAFASIVFDRDGHVVGVVLSETDDRKALKTLLEVSGEGVPGTAIVSSYGDVLRSGGLACHDPFDASNTRKRTENESDTDSEEEDVENSSVRLTRTPIVED